jgi:hypothetical protein
VPISTRPSCLPATGGLGNEAALWRPGDRLGEHARQWDEFHHASANPDNVLGAHLGEFISRD